MSILVTAEVEVSDIGNSFTSRDRGEALDLFTRVSESIADTSFDERVLHLFADFLRQEGAVVDVRVAWDQENA